MAAKKHQRVDLMVDITHDSCSGDVVRIHRVIDNILANALKFTPEGGIITYRISESVLEHKNISLYRFEISDTGIGIAPEQQIHIFEPFLPCSKPHDLPDRGHGFRAFHRQKYC
ncbi:MAG: ATP-binding protein [Oscillospiraceae bacterium]